MILNKNKYHVLKWWIDYILRSSKWPLDKVASAPLVRLQSPIYVDISTPTSRHRSANLPKTEEIPSQEYVPIFATGGLLARSFSIALRYSVLSTSPPVAEDNRLKLLLLHCLGEHRKFFKLTMYIRWPLVLKMIIAIIAPRASGNHRVILV